MFQYEDTKGQIFKHKICSYYNHEIMMSNLFAELIPFTIIIINQILKLAIIKMIEWVKDETLSV